MRIVFGLIGIVLSFLLIVYRVPIKHFIGQIRWAEEKLGAGGTYSVMVLAALFLFIFSLMYMTDSFDLIFGGVETEFFKTAK